MTESQHLPAGVLAIVPAPIAVANTGSGVLRLHLAGAHADPMAMGRADADNVGQHQHEHDGPGTIRSHSRGSMDYDLGKVRAGILEMLEDSDWSWAGHDLSSPATWPPTSPLSPDDAIAVSEAGSGPARAAAARARALLDIIEPGSDPRRLLLHACILDLLPHVGAS